MTIKEKSRKIGLNPNPNLILFYRGISYCFCSVFKWEWQIKWSPPPTTMFFFCQRLHPSFLQWQGVVKDALTSWHCSSVCFWSACCQESSHCLAGTWWRKGIDGVKNDEEMKVGDRQAAKTSVALLLWQKPLIRQKGRR